ncbi:MAG: hypothetical protein HRU75_03845 [Planctomycetia bacterium]|nr:MAG: hypothetical protein HRU75_03845 [Planctomycetia bacterium]
MFRSNMVKMVLGGLVAAGAATAVAQDYRVSASKKGSLLIYSNVEVKWNAAGAIIQDTFIEMSNDYPASVAVQLYFVNGDAPTATEPGWNWLDNIIQLTQDEPSYWSAASGLPKGVSPWSALDPGNPPGRPDPDEPGVRTLRGFIYGWAVDAQDRQIRWNHLTGKATIVNYADSSAVEYAAYAFQAYAANHGDRVGYAGHLKLNGLEYDYGFAQLLIDFFAAGSVALSGGGNVVGVDTDLTLHPVSADLRQDGDGPVITKAKFDIWNENEVRFSNTEKCISCWDQQLLSVYSSLPNHFLLVNLQTQKGKARVDGVTSTVVCGEYSINASLLGVAIRQLSFNAGQQKALAGGNLVGQGTESADIRYDVITPPGETREAGSNFGAQNSAIERELTTESIKNLKK